jgi:hypothetical protein
MGSSQDHETEDRERAIAASRDCVFCDGKGFVTVYHPTFTGDSIAVTQDGRQYPTTAAAHCRCELGVWMRDRTPGDMQRRIPRVEDICRGRSRWLLVPPHEREPEYPDRPVDAASFRAFWRGVQAHRAARLEAPVAAYEEREFAP